jgi:hypothetical protein
MPGTMFRLASPIMHPLCEPAGLSAVVVPGAAIATNLCAMTRAGQRKGGEP